MNILLVENNPATRNLLKNEIEQGGYQILMASKEEEIVDILEDSKISMIVIGIHHGDNSGFDLCKKIREKCSEKKKRLIPIIFFSDNDQLQERIESFHVGGDDYVDIGGNGTLLTKINSYLRPEMLWHGLKTVLVEDEKISAKFISHVIKSRGAEVKHFSNALNAYDYLKEKNDVDLILTDHIMPELTGIEFVKKVRSELGLIDIPIVFISSVQEKGEILKFFKAGGNDYVAKPIIKEELFVKVGQLLGIRVKAKILQKQVIELEQLNRLKDQFLAVCSHDLRTPLNTILGLSNLMLDEKEIDSDNLELVEQIENSAKSLLEMVTELLEFSEIQVKKDHLDVEKIDLLGVWNECIRGLNAINSKRIRIDVSMPKEPVYISGNKGMLARAFNNLISNSYKFTETGGEISLKVEANEKKVLVKFSDTGIGIPQESIGKLFDQLSGIGRKGLSGEKSTGLGMSIVKDILTNHGATIDVESKVGRGTKFLITFDHLFEGSLN